MSASRQFPDVSSCRRWSAHFILLLGVMAVAGVLADIINLPGIVGAFLAGLAVNAAVREHPAKAKVEFFVKALFVPSSFIVTGFLIDPVTFARSIVDNFPLVAGLVGTLLLAKWIAAAIAGRTFGCTRPEWLTVWSLTLPRVAAALAASLVAYCTLDSSGHRMLDETMLNAVLVLMLARRHSGRS